MSQITIDVPDHFSPEQRLELARKLNELVQHALGQAQTPSYESFEDWLCNGPAFPDDFALPERAPKNREIEL